MVVLRSSGPGWTFAVTRGVVDGGPLLTFAEQSLSPLLEMGISQLNREAADCSSSQFLFSRETDVFENQKPF